MVKDWHLFAFFGMTFLLFALAITSTQLPGGITGMVARDVALSEELIDAPAELDEEILESDNLELINEIDYLNETQNSTNNTFELKNNTNGLINFAANVTNLTNNNTNTNLSFNSTNITNNTVNHTNITTNNANITFNDTNNNSNTTGNTTNTTIQEEQKTNVVDSFFRWFGKLFSKQ